MADLRKLCRDVLHATEPRERAIAGQALGDAIGMPGVVMGPRVAECIGDAFGGHRPGQHRGLTPPTKAHKAANATTAPLDDLRGRRSSSWLVGPATAVI